MAARERLTIYTGTGQPFKGGLEITEYTLTLSRMGMPSLTATLKHKECLDNDWTGTEYVVCASEKFLLKEVSSSSKSTSDERYSHDLIFSSEREVLANTYFFDVVSVDAGKDYKPITNSTDFSFYGTLKEFIGRLNCALHYAGIGDSAIASATAADFLSAQITPNGDGYVAVIDPDGDYDFTETKEISFSSQYIWNAINEAYKIWEIPFSVRGKRIIFGEVEQIVAQTFEYGHNNELLSVGKNNKGTAIINDITAKGSSENIPYYYPNETEYGHISLSLGSDNNVLTSLNNVKVSNVKKLISLVRESGAIEYHYETTTRADISNSGGIYITDEDHTYDWEQHVYETPFEIPAGADIWASKQHDIPFRIWVNVTQYACDNDTFYAMVLNAWWHKNDGGSYSEEYVDLVEAGRVRITNCYTPGTTSNGNYATVNQGDELDNWTLGIKFPVEGVYLIEGFLTLDNFDLIANFKPVFFEQRVGRVNSYWTAGDRKYTNISKLGLEIEGVTLGASAAGDTIKWTGSNRMPFLTALSVPKFRNTQGEQRFYPALNSGYGAYADAYKDEDGKYYAFRHPYSTATKSQYEYTDDDIKPTIEGVRNTNGQLFGAIADVAFDLNDNDSLKASAESSDGAASYQHSYFYIRLNQLNYVSNGTDYSLDLFKLASQTDAMTICMTSGRCAGCKFKIQVVEKEDDWYNPVQVDSSGNLVSGDADRKVSKYNIIDSQQNTAAASVWLCVQKDVETFGVIMPNRTHEYLPQAGDTFNIVNIDLPMCYIIDAEKRLEQEMMYYMSLNNEERWSFDISLSRIWAQGNPDIMDTLDEYSLIDIRYNGSIYRQYVSSVTYEYKNESVLPEIKVELSDDIAATETFVSKTAAEAAKLLEKDTTKTNQSTNGGTTAVDSNLYLSKVDNDTAQGQITFEQGLVSKKKGLFDAGAVFGTFSSGFTGFGGKVDERGNAEFERLKVRSSLETFELLVNRLRAAEGDTVHAPSDTIESIDDGGDGTFTLHLRKKWDGYFTAFAEHDVVRGVYNSLAASVLAGAERPADVPEGSHGEVAAAYYDSWMRVNSVNAAANTINVTVYAAAECPGGSNHNPIAEMVIVRWGNTTEASRQSCIVLSATERQIKLLEGVTSPVTGKDNVGVLLGKAPEFLYDNGNPYNLNDLENILYVKRIFYNQSLQIPISGQHAKTIVDYGEWTAGADYPCDRRITDTNSPYYGQWITADVWHCGCRWRCCTDGTAQEPRWNATGWAMIEGNKDFKVEFTDFSPNDRFDFDNFSLTLTVRATLYGQDVTADIDPNDIIWTRKVVDAAGVELVNSDNIWATQTAQDHYGATSLNLTKADIGTFVEPQSLTYTCTCYLRDGSVVVETSQASLELT